jgi:microcystin-dependent protein
MTFFKWSRTASANDTADATCPFPENMAAGALNDGARGMMAAAAKYRDDVSGQLVTAGTSTAFTLSTFQGFNSLANMHGKAIYFTPHTTNGANGTSLNVDGLGVKPILTAPGVGLPGGVLVQGTPYGVVYNNTDGAFYVQGYFGDPYQIPIGGGLEFWGATLPNSSFAFPIGQAISRTTYSTLFGIMGTAHGVGDGSTTFNLPDKRERVSVMVTSAASLLTSAQSGVDSTVMGNKGGAQKQTVGLGHLPANITARNASQAISVQSSQSAIRNNPNQAVQAAGGALGFFSTDFGKLDSSGNNDITVTSNNTGAAAPGGAKDLTTVPPLIVCNYMIRII